MEVDLLILQRNRTYNILEMIESKNDLGEQFYKEVYNESVICMDIKEDIKEDIKPSELTVDNLILILAHKYRTHKLNADTYKKPKTTIT